MSKTKCKINVILAEIPANTTGFTGNLSLGFENGFEGWTQRYWQIVDYAKNANPMFKAFNVTPHNESSTTCGVPTFQYNSLIRFKLGKFRPG